MLELNHRQEIIFFRRYQQKNHDIIGLCEVENKLVIDDLLKKPIFNEHKYKIVHNQSPDGRGIDCGLWRWGL